MENNNENDNEILDNSMNSDSDIKSYSSIYSKDTFIYGWGKNTFGELGINSTVNMFIPTPINSFQSQIITSITSGGKNTIILNNEGKVFVSGGNLFGLLGDINQDKPNLNNEHYQKTFKLMKIFINKNEIITQIACAEFHVLALNKNGNVYAWGGNLYNKLGQSSGIIGQPVLIESLYQKKIISISCGDYHSCALTDNGELYSWGGGKQYNKGQCGHGTIKEIESPEKVEFFIKNKLKISKICCGGYHTIVLCNNGDIYSFGKGCYGQLGYGESEDSAIPKLVKFSQKYIQKYEKNYNDNKDDNKNENNNEQFKIIDIKCGGEHSVFLSSFGRVYVCGHGYHGQLGLGNTKNVNKPIIVMSLLKKKIIKIAAGWSHTIVLSDENMVYVTGCGKYGELGLKNDENINKCSFTLLKNVGKMNVKDIFAGGHHSWCITDNVEPIKENFQIPKPLDPPNYCVQRKNSNISFNSNVDENNDNFNNKKRNNSNYSNSNNYNFNDNFKRNFTQENKNIESFNKKNYSDNENLESNENYSNNFDNRKNNFMSNSKGINILNTYSNNNNLNPDFIFDNNKINLDDLQNNINNYSNNTIQIQVIYTDLNLIHRFIRFDISKTNTNFDLTFQQLELKIKEYLDQDKGNILYRLQYNNEVIDQLNNSNENDNLSSPFYMTLYQELKNYSIIKQIDSNIKSYCLNIVYDPDKSPLMKSIKEKNPKNNFLNEKPFIFRLYNDEDISKDTLNESVMSGWIINFYNIFFDLFLKNNKVNETSNDEKEEMKINIPKFYELRPYNFYSK